MDHTATSILEIGSVLLAAAFAGWGARRIGLPAIVGYLAIGLIVSPFTPGYVADRDQIQLLADLGVVLLLFEVGIEIDLARLGRDQRGLVWAPPVQVIITTAVSTLLLVALGIAALPAAVLGLAVALSSSVVIVNITKSRRRTTDPATERALLGWSVVQDSTGVIVAIVLLAAIQPAGADPIRAAVAVVAFIVVALVAARVVPWVLRHLRSEHDLFLLVSLAAGLILAGVGSTVFGVPLALAAFIAGLAISERPETAEARRRLLPFRDVFAVLFFVAIGTLVDPALLPQAWPWLLVFVGLVVVAKAAVAYVLARLGQLDARPGQLAIGLGQIGEFSFVLGSAALAAGAIDRVLFVALLAAVALTIAGSSVLVRFAGARPAAEVVGAAS